jgi:hypothetical protein
MELGATNRERVSSRSNCRDVVVDVQVVNGSLLISDWCHPRTDVGQGHCNLTGGNSKAEL